MRKLILRMAKTLDGLVAGEKDDVAMFDFSDQGAWTDLFATLSTVDTMIVGRGMHEGYFRYWQSALTSSTATPNERKYAAISAQTPHVVVSRTLQTVEWPNAKVLCTLDEIATLKKAPGRDIILYGGATLADAVIDAGLVDEYHFGVHPLIGGRGKKLFARVFERRGLRLVETQPLASGILLLKYRP